MSIIHSHAEVRRLKNRIALLEAQLRQAREDTALLDYRESKWQPFWKLPITIPNGGRRVFAEATYRASLRKHKEADGE